MLNLNKSNFHKLIWSSYDVEYSDSIYNINGESIKEYDEYSRCFYFEDWLSATVRSEAKLGNSKIIVEREIIIGVEDLNHIDLEDLTVEDMFYFSTTEISVEKEKITLIDVTLQKGEEEELEQYIKKLTNLEPR